MAAVFLASIMLLAALLPRSMLRPLFALFLAIAVLATAASARYPPTASVSRLALFGDAVLRLTALTLLGLALFRTVLARLVAVASAFQTAVMVNWSWLILLGAILAGTAIYVEASQRILFWDPTRYWNATDEVAQLFRNGFGWPNFLNLMRTAGDEYSMIPALIPGLLTVPLPAQFLLGYILAVCACYIVPALFAMAVLRFHPRARCGTRYRDAALDRTHRPNNTGCRRSSLRCSLGLFRFSSSSPYWMWGVQLSLHSLPLPGLA